MTRKIAQSTCMKCHGIFPRTEMQQKTIQEDGGSSFGISTNPSSKVKNSTRVSARSYKRKRKVWVCNECSQQDVGGMIKTFFVSIFKLLFFIAILSGLYSVFVN